MCGRPQSGHHRPAWPAVSAARREETELQTWQRRTPGQSVPSPTLGRTHGLMSSICPRRGRETFPRQVCDGIMQTDTRVTHGVMVTMMGGDTSDHGHRGWACESSASDSECCPLPSSFSCECPCREERSCDKSVVNSDRHQMSSACSDTDAQIRVWAVHWMSQSQYWQILRSCQDFDPSSRLFMFT